MPDAAAEIGYVPDATLTSRRVVCFWGVVSLVIRFCAPQRDRSDANPA